MRRLLCCVALALAACGPSEPPPPLPEPVQAADPPWFICDGVDAPRVLVFVRDGANVSVAEYDKPNGALTGRREFALGEPEVAAGSVFTPLMQDGAQAGHIRQVNPGMLETPGSAYTPHYSSIEIDERTTCRWLPRTRVLGFTGRRSFVVHEDADGDLIYTTYDFAAAAAANVIELSENGRSTTFSVEVRGGEELMSPDGVSYRFSGEDGYAYLVTLRRDGTGQLDVTQGGAAVQSEPLEAYQQGQAAAE